jgi:hypothetical protein
MSPYIVTATTATAPTIVPVMATEIKLYYGTLEINNDATDGKFLSKNNDTTCMKDFVDTTKAFHVYCTDQSKF